MKRAKATEMESVISRGVWTAIVTYVALVFLIVVGSMAWDAYANFSVKDKCQSENITPSTSDVYIQSNTGLDVTLFDFGETMEVALYTCASTTAASCDPYYWDHNGNGTKDHNTLDGDGAAFSRGVRTPNVMYIRAEVTTSPSTSNAFLMACPVL